MVTQIHRQAKSDRDRKGKERQREEERETTRVPGTGIEVITVEFKARKTEVQSKVMEHTENKETCKSNVE